MEPEGEHTGFLIVTGCPRSGTYMVAELLSRYFSVAFPLETSFIPLFYRFRFFWGDLKKPKNRANLLADIFRFLHIWNTMSYENTDQAQLRDYTLLAVEDQMETLVAQTNSYQTIVQALFAQYASYHNVERFGDKTVPYAPVPLGLMNNAVGRIRAIHVIRDPRDVNLSWRKTWFGPPSLSEGARMWRRHVIGRQRWGRHHADQYLELRYEDVLDDPESCVQKMSEFLGFEVAAAPDSSYGQGLASVISPGGTHDLLGGEVVRQNKEKWRRLMEPTQLREIEALLRTPIAACGYTLSGTAVSAPEALFVRLRSSLNRARATCSTLYLMRYLRNLLPLVVLAGRVFDRDIESMISHRIAAPSASPRA